MGNRPGILRRSGLIWLGVSRSPGKIGLGLLLAAGLFQYSAAEITNTVTVTGSFSGSPVTDAATENVDVVDAAPSMTVTKTGDTANVTAAGAVINYTITIDNTGNVSLTGISATDTLDQNGTSTGLTLTGPGGDSDSDSEIDPTETWTYTASHSVTQGQIDDGNDLVNTIDVTSTQTGATTYSDSYTTTITQTNSIAVTKTADVASVAAASDPIIYSVTVENTGTTTATAITVTDTLTTLTCPTSGSNTIASLAPGTSEICTVTYNATQADFDANGANDGGSADGDIDNTATANGTAGGVAVSDNDSTAVTLTINPGLSVNKTAVLNDEITADGFGEVGETITYSFAVENTGNVTITNVRINDTHNGSGGPLSPAGETLTTDTLPTSDSTDSGDNGIWESIAPGDIVTFTATYTVTQTDVDTLQ